jgi:hypothetical protein
MISGPVLAAIQSILAEDSICPDNNDTSNNTTLINERDQL